jgi:integrase
MSDEPAVSEAAAILTPHATETAMFCVNKAGRLQKVPVHAKRFKVTVCPCRLPSRPHLKWVVNIYHPTKGRERRYCRTKQHAENAANVRRIEAENFGLRGLELTAEQRLEAISAYDAVRPYAVTLTDVIREFVERRKGSLATFGEIAATFIESRRNLGRSKRHIDSVMSVIGRAEKVLGARRMSEITGSDLKDWIESCGVGPRTRNHFRTYLYTLFEFARRRKIVRENPAQDIECYRVPIGKVGILAPDEMLSLLERAKNEPDVLATLAIGGFAGLRPEEIKRLKWSAINLDRGVIDCGSEITKTAQHRYVKIEPVLTAWLKSIMSLFASSDEGAQAHIQRENFRRRYDSVRIAAGFSVRGHEGRPWPHDALRHSFGSYHIAHFKNAASTALEMGHEGPQMLFQHYRARVAEMTATAWWNLFPKSENNQ